MLAKFSGLNPEKENFCVVLTYAINREREISRGFLLFTVAVVIPKFCYLGNVTSNFSSLLAHKEARMLFS